MGRYTGLTAAQLAAQRERAAAAQRAANEAAAKARQAANEAAAKARQEANQNKTTTSSTPPALPSGVVLSSRPPGSVGEGGQGASGGSGLGSGFTGSGGGGVGTTPPSSTPPIMGDKIPTITFMGEVMPIDATSGWEATAGGAEAVASWNYLRDQVESVFTDLEGSFEAMTTSSIVAEDIATVTEVGAGVTADMVGLPEVLFSGGLLLAVGLFGWFETWIAQFIPNPGIFGFYPLHFIKKGIADGGASLEHQAMGIADKIALVFVSPIRQILGLFQRSHNATARAHHKIAYVVNTTIPNATKGLLDQANAYTDSQVAGFTTTITDAIASVRADLMTQIDNAEAAAKAHADRALQRLDAELVKQLTGDETTLASLANTITVTMPADIAAATATAVAKQDAMLTASVQSLHDQITALQTTITTATANVTTAQTSIAKSQANITALQSQQTVDETAISTERSMIATAQEDLLTNTTIITDAMNKITGISSTLGTVQAAQQLNTAQLAPFEGIGAVALPTVIATIAATLSSLKTKVDTCTVDTCDPTKPNNIRNVLKDLLGLMSAAGELAFIAEAIRDPLGTADTLAPGLDAIDSGAQATLGTLLGLLD